MKRFFTAILLLLTGTVFSQQYNNEWIDFSKVYYKFKVGRTGLYRIPQATLNAAGLGSTSAEQFKLIRNGAEVPLFTSVTTGQMGASDYIEFWGEMNDGKADRALYRDPAYQHSDAISLLTDTATFFLTVSTGPNLRLTNQVNNVASNVQPAEPYFMYKAGTHFKGKINSGFAKLAGDYIYSSSYDIGENWSTADIAASKTSSTQLTNLFVYAGGPDASIKFGASGNAPNARTLNLKINNNSLNDVSFSGFNEVQSPEISFSPSLIGSNSATVLFTNISAVTTDRMVISYYDITYPRRFNFGAAKNFPFTLPAKGSDYYLAITNFNKGTAVPVLYDLTNYSRYAAVAGGGDTIKFVLPASAQQRNLVLVNEETTNVIEVSALTPKTFTNFSNSANQGNYLIISNPLLYTGTSGNNPVNDYRNYRSSSAGGSYNVTITDIDELVDQFAFGIKKHPISIKNFLQFARDKYSAAPGFVLLIGRGVDYVSYNKNQSNVLADQINLIPTFGYPASDNMLSSVGPASAVAATPIGRLSVVKGAELENYLEKLKEYELAQRTAPNTVAGRLWMKNVMELTGASQLDLGVTLCNYMHGYKDIIGDTLAGANVTLFCKNSANPIEQLSGDKVTRLFEEGMSLLTYFGHSSSTTLEFNIDDPQNYNNPGKYPVFSVNGCNAGNFFTFDQQRLNVAGTLSEKFTLAKQRGGIAFLASTYYGLVNYLNIYVNAFYRNASKSRYGHTLGEIFDASLSQLIAVNAPGEFFARAHAEEITLHGDPALRLNFQEKPDYVMEDAQIKVDPSFVSIAENKFAVGIKIYNLGKAVDDSIRITVKRQYPDGSLETIYDQKKTGVYYSDSLALDVPIIGTRDKGTNKIIVALDADNTVDEMEEGNNTITKEVYIYEDEARPSFPYNYSIVSDPAQKLYASTANPFGNPKDYTIEFDTTALFNSPLKKSKVVNIAGGIIEYSPGINYVNNTVYYWRVGVPQINGELNWNVASFLFQSAAAEEGFNQSHAFQFGGNTFNGLNYQESARAFTFGAKQQIFSVLTTIYPAGPAHNHNWSLNWGNSFQQGFYAPLSSNEDCLRFYIIDGKSLIPWINVVSGSSGLYGSRPPVPFQDAVVPGFFHFDITTTAARKNVMDFLDMIPEGNYIVMTNTPVNHTILPSVWQGDTTTLGSNNSLYHKLKNLGFTMIDNVYNTYLPFVFIYRKGDNGIIRQQMGQFQAEVLTVNFTANGFHSSGQMTSELFGPAKRWGDLVIQGNSPSVTDSAGVKVIGVQADGSESTLLSLDPPFTTTSLASVDAGQYPYIKLQLATTDTTTYTPYQLSSWKIAADYVPEGALAPNIYFMTKDTLDVGEILNFGIAFKNISHAAFDSSMVIKMSVIDNDNNTRSIPLPRAKVLAANDTIKLNYQLDTRTYGGNNILSIDFNPDNAQAEQHHYNNFLFRNFYVRPDRINPLMDVTFDGVHILNNDIVSSRPHIQIKVKDEAKFMLLNDTSLVSELKVRYPDANGTIKTYKFNSDTLRFTPAQSGTNNTATIDFSPHFPTILDESGQPLNPDGDTYTLTIKSKDESGNSSGQQDYSVSFKVIDKPMISNLLNYPNPFTTSTAFVFTITGSEVPQNMKIQILTVTGKVVREITREELGPIHIGRNITEYKWNGTDQYGQRLGNGVYLYRVVTMLNGKRMDKYISEGDDTDKYFTKGYGKMYLMR